MNQFPNMRAGANTVSFWQWSNKFLWSDQSSPLTSIISSAPPFSLHLISHCSCVTALCLSCDTPSLSPSASLPISQSAWFPSHSIFIKCCFLVYSSSMGCQSTAQSLNSSYGSCVCVSVNVFLLVPRKSVKTSRRDIKAEALTLNIVERVCVFVHNVTFGLCILFTDSSDCFQTILLIPPTWTQRHRLSTTYL